MMSFLTLLLAIPSASSVRAAGYPVGDLDGTCEVNWQDTLIFVGQWLDPSGHTGYGNANLDGLNGIDLSDFALLAQNWFIASGCPSNVTDTKFSHDRGFYDAPFDVVISTEMSGAIIKYTLDGSDPRISPSAFSGPNPCTVTIDPASTDGRRPTPAVTLRAYAFRRGLQPTNVDAQTYVFLDEVIDQAEIKPTGSHVFWTTSMDPDVTQDRVYERIMDDALLSIPTMSVTMDWEDLFGTSGIHRGNNLAKADYEKPCSLELIYPDSPQFAGFEGFQVDCGIRIQGGGGRWDNGLYDHKQSFGIRFRREYGTGTLNYAVFESAPFNSDSEAGEYDKLVLRAGHNKSWGATWDNVHTVYTRDQFGRDLQIAMSGVGSRGTFVHLYLNGIYWGLYNLCERPDHAFSASYLEGTKEDYYSGKKKGGDISGDDNRFDYWRNNVSSTSDFSYLQQYLAVDQYIDMALLGVYANPGDYPQYYFGNCNSPAGQVYFYQWDIEDAFGGGSRRSGDPSSGKLGSCYEFGDMWNNNAEFRIRLADRAYRACYNHGVFTDEEITERWLQICDYVYLAIVGESARWGDERYGDKGSRGWGGNQYHDLSAVYTRDGYWAEARDAVTADLQGRATLMISRLRSSSYYPSINPPVFKHGSTTIDVLRKEVPAGYSLTIQRDGTLGTLYYTMDGSDPRAPDGTVRGINGSATTTITIDTTTNVKARTKSGSEWSALHEAVFFVDQDFSDLKITEIMYNPLPAQATTGLAINRIVGNDIAGGNYDLAKVELSSSPPSAVTESDKLIIEGANIPENNGTFTIHHVSGRNVVLKEILMDEISTPATADLFYDGDRYEFVEFKNSGASTLNLSGVTFTNGITYTFPDGTCLAPGKFAVVASDTTDFADRYPGADTIGEYSGNLDNGGEELEVSLGTGEFFPVSRIVGNDGGRGKLIFAELPTGLSPADRVRIVRANNASNNGMYKIAAIQGNQVCVTSVLTDEGPQAKGTFFKVITTVSYDDEAPWQLAPDALGYSLVPTEINPTGNPDDFTYWRTSANIHGSPGENDPEPPLAPTILVNEALTHTDWPQVDTIELYNPVPETVDLGGWWLTDDKDEPRKYRIPSANILAGDYLVIEEDNDNNPLNIPPANYFGGAFSLSSHGEEVYLFSPDLRYSRGFEFGAAETGVSFGRHVTSQGDEHFVAQAANSFGLANSGPKVGPVVISEIMYHPDDGDHEFVELVNFSPWPVALYNLNDRWKVSGLNFIFPANIVLQPNEVLLLVCDTTMPDDFRIRYGVAGGVRIFNYTGKLDNGGERIRLMKPDLPDEGEVPYIVVDEVSYDDEPPWPAEPDGDGPSLERIHLSIYGNDPTNWRKSDNSGGTPGRIKPVTEPLIAVAPSDVTLLVTQGQNLEDESFEVWNAGVDILNYSINDDVGWMDVPAAAGSSTGRNDKQVHAITFFTSSLPAGMHVAAITISSASARNSPVTIRVTVNVKTPEIALSTRGLEPSVARGRDAPDQTFEVWNQGVGTLSYSIVDDVGWLSVSPDRGTLIGSSDRILHTVSYDTDSLAGGIHNAMITVIDPFASNSPQAINVALEILTPEIALSTTSLAPRAGEGGSAPNQTFEVWNSGVETLNYAITYDAGWLSVTPNSGSSNGAEDKTSHTVIYDTHSLALGEHSATITITDPAASNDPRTISVTLTISEQRAFVAYNDLNSTNSTNAPNVTGYDYSASQEPLKDFNTGDDLFATVTGSVSPPGAYDPYGTNGGNFTNVNSDAYWVFNGIVDLTGVFELDATDWSHIITFNNLEPDREYTIALTTNRDNASYGGQRFTKVTIEGAESYTNVSSMGVVVNSEASISFGTGYNTVNGYVAKWTGIATGPDGSFSIRSEWDNRYPGKKGYAMSAFRLESHGR